MKNNERIFISENKNQKLNEKILDLKKENLLLLQQNIDKDKEIEELKNKINVIIQTHKENIVKHTSEIRDICSRKVQYKIKELNSNKGLLNTDKINYTINVLEELKGEI